jgi:hypothetical protein
MYSRIVLVHTPIRYFGSPLTLVVGPPAGLLAVAEYNTQPAGARANLD